MESIAQEAVVASPRTLLLRMTDHGLGHFLSACVMYGRLAEADGTRTIIDMRQHPIANSLVTPVYPSSALGWVEALDAEQDVPLVGNVPSVGRKRFSDFFDARKQKGSVTRRAPSPSPSLG